MFEQIIVKLYIKYPQVVTLGVICLVELYGIID